ncbi:MAG: hypothetical protein ACLRX5_01615 [Slackia sp.]
MLFRKTIVAALTFSLALGWSPTSYRAYANTQASAEADAHSQPVEQNTASGGGLSEVEGFDLSFFDNVFSPITFFDEAPVDGGPSGENGSNGGGSDATAPNEGAPDNSTSNGEDSSEGTSDENVSGEESLEGNASDEVSDAEQDAAQIEGAEVLQQGDGETTGNVLVADRAAVEALGGRDFAGQVVKEINGTKYILIGNEQQLRAIGSGKRVYTPVYQAIYHDFKGWEVDKDENGEPIMLYGGDADLLALQNGKKDFTFEKSIKPTAARSRPLDVAASIRKRAKSTRIWTSKTAEQLTPSTPITSSSVIFI